MKLHHVWIVDMEIEAAWFENLSDNVFILKGSLYSILGEYEVKLGIL